METTAPARCEIDGGVAIVTLDNASSRNALSRAMIATLMRLLGTLSERTDIRAVVLQAEGPAFCAGHDLRELTAHRGEADGGRQFFTETMAACAALMRRIMTLPQPVIAAVDGVATAAGCQLVATCDLAVAGPQARFATPGVSIGLFCSTPAVPLSRAIARKHAMEMLLTGDLFDAETAARVGLVNRIAAEGARDAALAMARKIATKSRHALIIGKETFYRQIDMTLAEAYDHASAVMVENLLLGDAVEGIDAFLGKRPPVWPEDD